MHLCAAGQSPSPLHLSPLQSVPLQQATPLKVLPTGQANEQSKIWFGSECVSTHCPPQHVPIDPPSASWQLSPKLLVLQSATGTHVPGTAPTNDRPPSGARQTVLDAHWVPQPPQLLGSVAVMHPPSQQRPL